MMESFQMFWEGRSASDRLYHLTYLNNVESICKSNRFNLSYSGGEEVEQFKYKSRSKSEKYINSYGEVRRSVFNTHVPSFKKNYYLSTARSIYSSILDITNPNLREKAIIELDGSKLADRYEIIPTNYYRSGTHNTSTDEMEDRVITNKPYIENAKRYIVAIHVHLRPHNQEEVREHELKILKDIASMGYTVYLYNQAKDIKFLRREKAEIIRGSILTRISNKIKGAINPQEEFKTDKDIQNEGYVRAAYDFIINPTYETLVELIKNDIEYENQGIRNNPTPAGMYYMIENMMTPLPTKILYKLAGVRTSKNTEIRKQLYKFSELQRKTNKKIFDFATEAYEKVKKELSVHVKPEPEFWFSDETLKKYKK